MEIEDIKEISNRYNVSELQVLEILKSCIKEHLDVQEIVIKKDGNRYIAFEQYLNKNGVVKTRKLRFAKGKIKEIYDDFVAKMIRKSREKIVVGLFSKRVTLGEVVGRDRYSYFVELEGHRNIKTLLPLSKASRPYKKGDKAYFHINKIRNGEELVVILDDMSKEIVKKIIYDVTNGYYIKNLKVYKDFIKIKTIPKLRKEDRELIELNIGKKVRST